MHTVCGGHKIDSPRQTHVRDHVGVVVQFCGYKIVETASDKSHDRKIEYICLPLDETTVCALILR